MKTISSQTGIALLAATAALVLSTAPATAADIAFTGGAQDAAAQGVSLDVAYIESTGAQYIDTGVTMVPGLKAELVASFANVTSDGGVLGGRTGTSSVNKRYMMLWIANSRFYFSPGPNYNTVDDGSPSFSPAANKIYSIVADFGATRQTLTIDGVQYMSLSEQDYVAGDPLNLYVFAGNWYGTTVQSMIDGARLWSLKLTTEAGVVVRDYVPARKNGIYGLWDKENRVFHGSSTSTPFVGVDLDVPFCESSSAQHIDTACALAMPMSGVAATSADYVARDHLLIQWDGIDNAGTGVHDSNATTWKNIAPNATAYDLALTGNGDWSGGKALSVNGASATYDAGAAPSCKTIEVVFKMTENKGSLLLYGGNQTTRQLVAFAQDGTKTKCYCEGLSGVAHPAVIWDFNPAAIRSVVATFSNPGQIASAMFADGVERTDGSHTSGWGLTTQKIVLGAYDTRYPWVGEVYAVRMYDCVLTPGQIAINHAIDMERFTATVPTSADYVQDGLVAQ